MTIAKINEMISGLTGWLAEKDYYFYEMNHVPPKLFCDSHRINMYIRTFYRLSPMNFRPAINNHSVYTFTPQSLVSLLKAFNVLGDEKITMMLLGRVLLLKSAKTKNFALKQGMRITISLYDNDSEDPTPLNTVWFGEYLLDESNDFINENFKNEILLSIAKYLVSELGYSDHGKYGIYFHYGPTLLKEIYNSSAVISAFLMRVGVRFNLRHYFDLGERGIRYILKKQNSDGSWFYIAPPERHSIDNFHHAYILRALCDSKIFLHDLSDCISKGFAYYKKNLFKLENSFIRPLRYDKRYIPRNTWVFQKVDGRDLSEALILFSTHFCDKKILCGLIDYLYDFFYDKKMGCFACEINILGKNKIPYLEFQGWILHALAVSRNHLENVQNEYN